MNPYYNDFGAWVDSSMSGIASLTAAGTGDNTAVTGQSVDLIDYDGIKVVLGYKAALTDAKSLKLAVEYQESADDSSWDTAVALQASTIAVTSDGGTTEYGTVEFDLDASKLKRYVRVNFTPDLDAAGTDTALVSCIVIKGGKK
jgi:hypothetical protein